MPGIQETISLAEAASKREDWPAAIKYWQAVLDQHGPKAPKKFRTRLWWAQQALNSEEALRRNRSIFKALADPEKLIWVDPQDIHHKVGDLTDAKLYNNAILPGDWDLDLVAISDTIKYQSLQHHFVHGVAWNDTDLFGLYAKRIARGEVLRGCNTIAELKEEYRKTIDPLYEDMKQNGFVIPKEGGRITYYIPYIHVGRSGEILFGRAGNHRLAIAKILKLERFPCLVRARHADWQALREQLFCGSPETRCVLLGEKLVDHPDLADLIK